MAEIKYEIKEQIGYVSESAKGWKKEINLVSWNYLVERGTQSLKTNFK
jgi:hypothetical protein